jgi:hypothetical protein
MFMSDQLVMSWESWIARICAVLLHLSRRMITSCERLIAFLVDALPTQLALPSQLKVKANLNKRQHKLALKKCTMLHIAQICCVAFRLTHLRSAV